MEHRCRTMTMESNVTKQLCPMSREGRGTIRDLKV
ncbi:uncharacterized protein G2W53_020526 [Senna tora]|uniref:Uncharacterized protein n=1 Tax=Senna tora TaxID=362788 RepID=A0A834TY21_9FABA|nr:uncharacterized protein G2W53_020526 [Senna tora]